MIKAENIEIFILYQSDFRNEEINFNQLMEGERNLDSEHYISGNFWGATGGLQILINDYMLIFNSSDFENIVKVTNFLLHSLYWTRNIICDRFDKDEFYPSDVVLRTTSKNTLRLKKSSGNNLILSFAHFQENHIRRRGERFFENIIIEQNGWEIAAYTALSEYFEVLMRAVNSDSDSEYNRTMIEYHKVFSSLISRLN